MASTISNAIAKNANAVIRFFNGDELDAKFEEGMTRTLSTLVAAALVLAAMFPAFYTAASLA